MTSVEYDRALEEQASALTTCSICTDIFKVPKVLPCQHTFCLGCLESHHDATNSQRLVPVSSFACPTCRKVCYVPRHTLDQLPTDFKVDQILDLVKVMSRSRASSLPSLQKSVDVQGQGHECVVCRLARSVATPSEVFCVQCARSFCSACAAHHSRTPVFQGHTVVPAGASASVSAAWNCALHDLEVQYFCDQCVAPACAICVLSIHECHSVSDQRTVVGRLRGHLTRSLEQLRQRREDFKSQLEEVGLLREEHLRNLQETERTVMRSSREAFRRIKELEEQTLTDVRSSNRDKLDRMDSTERELSARMESLTELCHDYSDVLALTDLRTFFDSYSQLAVRDEAEVGEDGPEVAPTLRDVSTFVARIQVRLGEVEKKVIDVEALPRVQRKGVDGVRAFEAESKRMTMVRKDTVQPRDTVSSSGLSSATEQRQGHDPGQGQSDGQGKGQLRGRRDEFQSRVEHRQIQRSNSSVNTINSVNSTNIARTNSTVVIGSSNCSTSSNNSFSSSGGNVNSSCKSTKNCNASVGYNSSSSLNSTVESSAPRNSTTSNNSGTMRTSNTSNNRSKSTPRSNGNQATQSTNSSRSTPPSNGSPQLLWEADGFFRCTDCTFTSNGQQLVATDHAVVSNRVKLFTSSDGRLVDTVDSCLIVQPWGLCYNASTSSILLTDHGNPSLKTIRVGSTREVRVYRCQSDRPSGVAVTRSGDLVLTDTGSRRFKVGVYSIAQNRMSRTREFGCHGDGEGEVLRANYVIVDHNDRVIVSDCESHTVKVFSLTGQQLLRFSSSSGDGREMCPQGVVVDDANNILVADQASRAVVKYSPHGQLIDTVVQTTGLPWGISVSWEEKILAVATDRGLEVYRL